MEIGYARVSTTDQKLDRQIKVLKKARQKKYFKRECPVKV